VTKVMKKATETKYVAQEVRDIVVFGNLNPNAVGLSGGSDQPSKRMFFALPQVFQGTSAHNRIGNFIEPVKCKVTVQYYFVRNPQAESQDIDAVTKSGLYEVRQLSFSPKGIKRWGDWSNASGNTDHGYKRILPALLEVGDGSLTYADGTNPLNMTYPLTNELVTAHKGNKHFMLGKNSSVIGDSLASQSTLAAIRAQNTLHFKVKLPKKLKYPEVGGAPDSYPDNACPLFGAYAGIVQNASATSYDGLQQPYLPPNALNPKHPILQMNYRVELWFKDV